MLATLIKVLRSTGVNLLRLLQKFSVDKFYFMRILLARKNITIQLNLAENQPKKFFTFTFAPLSKIFVKKNFFCVYRIKCYNSHGRMKSMKQISYKLDKREDFLAWTAAVLSGEEYNNYNEILFKFVTSDLTDFDTKDVHRRIKKHFPKAKVVGVSMTNFVFAPEDVKNKSCVIITCNYFDSAKLKIFEVDAHDIDNYSDMAHDLNDKLKAIPDLKGVEVFCADGREYISTFMDIVTKDLEDVPFFGARAGTSNIKEFAFQKNDKHDNFYGEGSLQFVAGHDYHTEGIVLVAYSGEDLHIQADYNLGWKPIGKEMTVKSWRNFSIKSCANLRR